MWADQLNLQRHLAERVGGAAEAGIVSANHGFYAVQHAARNFLAIYIAPRNLEHAAIHGEIVLPSSDDQIGPGNQPILIDLVVMEGCATWSFRRTNSLWSIGPGDGAHVFGKDFGIVEQLLDPFNAIQDLDEARLVIVK